MHLSYNNVNDAFYGLVKGIHTGEIPTVRTSSRVGDVLQVVEPMLITYRKPWQRVLFNQARDANPFFHLFESLWMLAGRNDVAPLKYYASGIGDIASDDGFTFNGAYGYRWRANSVYDRENSHIGDVQWKTIDQLQILIDHLKAKPESRRAVLQMWNVEDDLLKIDKTKDVCCNLSVMFSLRKEEVKGTMLCNSHKRAGEYYKYQSYLDMTVTNRSNDMIWGMLGANVVHFSFLQEYMANCLGVEIGVYSQFTNNLHVYVENNGGFKPEEWLAEHEHTGGGIGRTPKDENWYPERCSIPLVENQARFDEECGRFVHFNFGMGMVQAREQWKEPFLRDVAQPMMNVFHCHKQRKYLGAEVWLKMIASEDWYLACTNWILKRKSNWEAKQNEL